MTLERFEIDSQGRIFCPADPSRITHNIDWPTVNGSWTFQEPAWGVVIHTEVGYEHNVIDEFNNPNAQASAFASNGMDGHLHQYGPIGKGWKAWTQAAGNPHWRGIENEDHGDPTIPMTDAQMDTLAAFIEVCSHRDGFPIQPTDNPFGLGGVIFHVDGGSAWGGHNCPGAVREHQRAVVIGRAQHLRATRKRPPAPNPAPAPAWVTRPTKDKDMAVLLKAPDKPDVFISNGVTKRHVTSQHELQEDIAAGLVDGKIHEVSQSTLDAQPTVTA